MNIHQEDPLLSLGIEIDRLKREIERLERIKAKCELDRDCPSYAVNRATNLSEMLGALLSIQEQKTLCDRHAYHLLYAGHGKYSVIRRGDPVPSNQPLVFETILTGLTEAEAKDKIQELKKYW